MTDVIPFSRALSQCLDIHGVVRHFSVWLVSFMQYDLGYIDLEEKTLQTLENPLGPKLSPMS